MTKQKFKEKYYYVIAKMYAAGGKTDMDDGITCDKLISSVRGHFGETYKNATGVHKFDIYPGIPEDFDWEGAYEDYKKLIA